MGEVLRLVREEHLREAVIPGAHCQTGVPVVRLHDRHDLALLHGVPGRLERDVDRLATAGTVNHLRETSRGRRDERFGERGAGKRREVVIADIEVLHRHRDGLDDLWIAVAEVVRAAIEVSVDKTLARHVVDEVFLAPIDDERHAGVDPELGLARIPVLLGLLEHLGLRCEREQSVIEGGWGVRERGAVVVSLPSHNRIIPIN